MHVPVARVGLPTPQKRCHHEGEGSDEGEVPSCRSSATYLRNNTSMSVSLYGKQGPNEQPIILGPGWTRLDYVGQ